ncbi:MAG: cysteine--tRNA ligase [Oscillospiraceae bacterium]|nr:cysteine--tRNA ligase [Oscillospiraceae bacterium]
MVDIREQSPLTLAFVGDAVYTLLIREHIATDKRQPINKLNQLSVKYISAKGQFMALGLITEILTEAEQNMVRRGKNASKASVAKHASVEEYRSSTGFECMLGYLKLTGQDDRIKYLVDYIFENLKFEN